MDRRRWSKIRAVTTGLLVAACGGGTTTATPDTTPSPPWTAVASGDWVDGALAAALPAPVTGVGRPGGLTAPEALAVVEAEVWVLDRARARVVAFDADGAARVVTEHDALAAATDLVATPDGGVWVALAGGRVAPVDRLAQAFPLAEELAALPLAVGTDSALYVGELGGSEVYPLRVEGATLAPDAQVAGRLRGLPGASGWVATVPADGAVVTLSREAATETVPLPGRALAVALLTPAPTRCGAGALLLVTAVLTSEGQADVLTVVTPGQGVGGQRVAPTPAPYHTPLRAFAASPAGDVWQLRLEPGGWQLARWEVPCED